MLVLLVVGILIAGSSPGYGQEPDPGTIPAAPVLNGVGPEIVPIVTRAWAHDDFGRIVFDWPWVVAYGARIEGKTLTVMFDRRLHTTFQQIPRHLGTYITDVALGPDGQSVVALLTDEYRLRTFLLNNEEGGVKVVVDLLADGEAGPGLAQAPAPPSPAPPPEAVPVDAPPSPHISGDAPLPLAEAAPPSLPFAIETDPAYEDAPESPPLIGVRASSPQAAKMAALPGSGGGEEEAAPPVKADTSASPAEPDLTPESAQTAEAPPPVETEAASEAEAASSGEADAAPDSVAETASEDAPDSSPPIGVRASSPQAAKMAALPGSGGGEEGDTPPVKADAETPPAESDSSPESVPTAEAPPPVEETTAPESGAEEATPPAEPTPETVSEETLPVETAISPHPDPLPEGEGEGVASTPDAPSEETAAVI